MKVLFYSSLFFLFALGCVSTNNKQQSADEKPQSRSTATEQMPCEIYRDWSGAKKQSQIYGYHWLSVQENLKEKAAKFSRNGVVYGTETGAYVEEFVGGVIERIGYARQALTATTQFLSPGSGENLGYKRLKPTFNNNCEFFQEPNPGAKKVHALGTLAMARMDLFAKIEKLDSDDQPIAKLENPWTGLFQPVGNEGGIPLLIRMSIANPVGATIPIGGENKTLQLEFIPGIGIKFLLDKKRSIDLVSMESLAGQSEDHNFFKYEFSPDFSAHAPPNFSTAIGAEQDEMNKRYGSNKANQHVMNLVGERFYQVIPEVTNLKTTDLNPHDSSEHPHPFAISIQNLSQFRKDGKEISLADQKRPWRLVFKPALDKIEDSRRKLISNSTPKKSSFDKIEKDFRFKLAHLRKGDRIYDVIAETKSKSRYKIGEIILESTPSPSLFADRLYFIQHHLDMRSSVEVSKTITEPRD